MEKVLVRPWGNIVVFSWHSGSEGEGVLDEEESTIVYLYISKMEKPMDRRFKFQGRANMKGCISSQRLKVRFYFDKTSIGGNSVPSKRMIDSKI